MWNITKVMIDMTNNKKKENTMNVGEALMEAISNAVAQELESQLEDVVKNSLESVVENAVEAALEDMPNQEREIRADEISGLDDFVNDMLDEHKTEVPTADDIEGLVGFVENIVNDQVIEVDDIVNLDKEIEESIQHYMEENLTELVKNEVDSVLSSLVQAHVERELQKAFADAEYFKKVLDKIVGDLVSEKLQAAMSNLFRGLLAVPVASPVNV